MKPDWPGRGMVEYCLNNVDDETRAALLRAGPGVAESSCLQRCGACYAGPFLVVDGEEIDGAAHEELLRRALPGSAGCGVRGADYRAMRRDDHPGCR